MPITPEHTPVKITASTAERSGWDPQVMQAVDRALAASEGSPFQPDEQQRAALQAWMTATDHRIGKAIYTSDADPMAYAYVAGEVTRLDDYALMRRYAERRRETAENRYQARPVALIAEHERSAMASAFNAAAHRFTSPAKRQEGDARRAEHYARAGREVIEGIGYLVWDRINHRYTVALWAATAEEIMRECDRLNLEHRTHYASRLWG